MIILIRLCLLALLMSRRLLSLWCFIVVISLAAVRLMDSPEAKFKYFFFSEAFTLLFFASIIFSIERLAPIFLCIKVGIPPFHSWMVDLFMDLDSYSRVSILLWVKLLPAIVIVTLRRPRLLFLFFVSWGFRSVAPLLSKPLLKFVFIYGSLSNYRIIFICATHDALRAAKILIVYTWMLATVWSIYRRKEITFNLGVILNFIGLPPFPLFFIKFFVFSGVFERSAIAAITGFIVLSGLFISYFFRFITTRWTWSIQPATLFSHTALVVTFLTWAI